MAKPIPTTMRALVLPHYDPDIKRALNSLTVRELPMPKPARSEVLIKLDAAPCNPADILFMQGLYGYRKTLPCIPGMEGVGIVVATGGNLMARRLMGRRVACAAPTDGAGTWAEYIVVGAANCIPLHRDVPTKQAASLIVNPLSAIGLFEIAKQGKHKAIVQNAAASQLGRMCISLARQSNIPLINIVRKEEQIAVLKNLDAQIVLNSTAPDFDKQLRELCEKHKATLAFDAVGGPMTGRLVRALPRGGKVVVYGALSYQPCTDVEPLDLVFHNKRVEGFWLSTWLTKLGVTGMLSVTRKAQSLIRSGAFHTIVREMVPLEGAPASILDYAHRMSQGKLLIAPHGRV